MEGLEVSIMNLALKNKKDDDGAKAELISKLELARIATADEERLVRKAAWIAKARKEVLKRRQFGGTVLAEVLPELTWELVLNNLDSKNKAFVSSINLLWRDLLKIERTTFLFQAVFPLLHPYLSRNEILAFRAVCNEWKQSLDNYLQNQLAYQPRTNLDLDVEEDPAPDNMTMKLQGEWLTVADFLDWTTETYDTGPEKNNPFISRKLLLEYQYAYDIDINVNAYFHMGFWSEVKKLLGEWGGHVWEADIFLDETSGFKAAYNQVRVLSTLMPNLRYFVVDGELLGAARSTPTTTVNVNPKSLEKCMKKHPLPELPHLKTLILQWIPGPIISELVGKWSSTLETLQVFEKLVGSPNACIGNISLPNLKRFYYGAKFPSLALATPIFSARAFPCLEELGVMFFNLEAANVLKLFQYLNGLEELELRRLTLWLHNVFGPLQKLDERELKMLELKLPHIEEFTMTVCRINLKTVDFILPMASLKKLNIVYEKHVSSLGKLKKPEDKPGPSKAKSNVLQFGLSVGEIIQFGSYTNRLYESNIWKLFPELKMVTIGTTTKLKKKGELQISEGNGTGIISRKQKVYTREGYKQFCKDLAAAASS